MLQWVASLFPVFLGVQLVLSAQLNGLEKRVVQHTGGDIFDMKRQVCSERKKIMFTDDMSYTVRYEKGQILESTLRSHWSSIELLHGAHMAEKVLWHPLLFCGYLLPGDVSQGTLDFVRSLPGVQSIGRSKAYRTHSIPWGLDRIDQKRLPLDGQYKPDFDGTGVNIFIVDSGIDTEHSEFSKNRGSTRVVQNVFDAHNLTGSSLQNLPKNNDGVGHGTHVAGIVGGNNVGVSPGANLWGVRVLNNQGAGADVDILTGLAYVLNWHIQNGRPRSVVSMSLGGDCISYEDCQKDVLVEAVEILSKEGIVVVTAAGNSDCDSCLQTPAYAPHGITVGASSIKDEAAVFSEFGKCVDIYAPGVNISSSCGLAMCPAPLDKLISLSGTSMACPHVSGVVAQLLQANPNATVDDVSTLLSCDSSRMVLNIVQDRTPAITRNLLLQIPKKSIPSKSVTNSDVSSTDTDSPATKIKTCNMGLGCEKYNMCSGRGICQEGRCLCDALAWGSNCSVSEFGTHCDKGFEFVPYTLYNAGADSWHGAEMRISKITATGSDAILTTSMCAGYESKSGSCLEIGGNYQFEVSLPETSSSASFLTSVSNSVVTTLSGEVGWSMCGENGGVPSFMQFTVYNSSFTHPETASNAPRCKAVCDTGVFEIALTANSLVDPTGVVPANKSAGWNKGYYSLLDERTGVVFAGGSLIITQNATTTHRICIPQSVMSSTIATTGKSTAASGHIVAVFNDGTPGSYSSSLDYRKRSWSACGQTQSLQNDFAFFDFSVSAEAKSALKCNLITPKGGPERPVSRGDKNVLKPTLIGLFSSHIKTNKTFTAKNSQWYERSYVILERGVDETTQSRTEISLTNGSLPSTFSAAQYSHALNGLKDWVLKTKKNLIYDPSVVPLPPIGYHPSRQPTTSPSYAPTTSASPTVSPTSSAVPTPLPTAVPSAPVAKGVPTPLPTAPVAKGVPTPVPTAPVAKGLPTPVPLAVPTAPVAKGVPTPVPTAVPAAVPTAVPSAPVAKGVPTPVPTAPVAKGVPIPLPTAVPTAVPSAPVAKGVPTPLPTAPVAKGVPTPLPTAVPLAVPTAPVAKGVPTPLPTAVPLAVPTAPVAKGVPTPVPTPVPTAPVAKGVPTPLPTPVPTAVPTALPTPVAVAAHRDFVTFNSSLHTTDERTSEVRAAIGSVTSLTSSENPYWMSCGVRGNLDTYYKFHRTDTALGCERSCAMLNISNNATAMQPTHFEDELVFGFFTQGDEFAKLEGLRQLNGRNFVCMGNGTSPSDPQNFRMILGGGENFADPVWQFCNLPSVPATAVVEFEVIDYTECSAKIVHQPSCPSPEGDMKGMYILMYDDKGGGWSGAEYSLYSAPATFHGVARSIGIPSESSSLSNTGETSTITEKPDPYISRGYTLVANGALEKGRQTGYSSVCVRDGCYLGSVSVGKHPADIAWVFCGAIGSAGMEGVYKISNGRCSVVPSIILCQLEGLYPKVAWYMAVLSGFTILCICGCFVGLLAMCFRSKVSNVRDSLRNTGGIRDDNSSTSPFHGGYTGTIAVGGPAATGEFEMAPRSDALPRVFNGDYRQLPTETEDDELHNLI